jgi:heme-degrading monooxygenase HmoA
LVFDVWDVPDGNQQAVVERLRALFEQVRGRPGFVEAALYESLNHRRVLAMARFASVAERQAAMDEGEVGAALRDLRNLAHPQMSTYEVVQVFRPPRRQPGAGTVSS